MKQIKVNPNNEMYYSDDFIKGFNEGAKRQFEADIAERKTEPQKDCKSCKHYEKCKNNHWKCCVYQPKDEPQTDCKTCKQVERCERGRAVECPLTDSTTCEHWKERKDIDVNGCELLLTNQDCQWK